MNINSNINRKVILKKINHFFDPKQIDKLYSKNDFIKTTQYQADRSPNLNHFNKLGFFNINTNIDIFKINDKLLIKSPKQKIKNET